MVSQIGSRRISEPQDLVHAEDTEDEVDSLGSWWVPRLGVYWEPQPVHM
jgi:hypothetical protein